MALWSLLVVGLLLWIIKLKRISSYVACIGKRMKIFFVTEYWILYWGQTTSYTIQKINPLTLSGDAEDRVVLRGYLAVCRVQ